MALLSDADRRQIMAEFMRAWSDHPTVAMPCGKPALLAAIGGLDGYQDANAAAINQAIPQPARGALPAKMKADLFMRIAARRYGVTNGA